MAEKEDSGASKAARSQQKMMREEKAMMRKAEPEVAKVEYIDEYTVVAGDTMGGIALNYYGSAVEEKWMAIYEANKEVIGDNPRLIIPGQVLKIPNLGE